VQQETRQVGVGQDSCSCKLTWQSANRRSSGWQARHHRRERLHQAVRLAGSEKLKPDGVARTTLRSGFGRRGSSILDKGIPHFPPHHLSDHTPKVYINIDKPQNLSIFHLANPRKCVILYIAGVEVAITVSSCL